MNSKTILRYLSSASDTFLLVAFGLLVTMPFAFSMAVQPIKDSSNIVYPSIKKTSTQVEASTVKNTVLGVSTTIEPTTIAINPGKDFSVAFNSSQDQKRYNLLSTSLNSNSYTLNGEIKSAGSYNLATIMNSSSTANRYNISFSFANNYSATYTLNVNGTNYSLDKKDNEINNMSIDRNSQLNISLSTNSKIVSDFKMNITLS